MMEVVVTWVKRAPEPDQHECSTPTKEVTYTLPKGFAGGKSLTHTETVVDGALGDLWRCDLCGQLWCCRSACRACDARGYGPHPGQHRIGVKWRPASWWQRFRNRKTADVLPIRGGDVD